MAPVRAPLPGDALSLSLPPPAMVAQSDPPVPTQRPSHRSAVDPFSSVIQMSVCAVLSECGGGLLSVAAREGAGSHDLRRQPQKGRTIIIIITIIDCCLLLLDGFNHLLIILIPHATLPNPRCIFSRRSSSNTWTHRSRTSPPFSRPPAPSDLT